MSLATSQQRYDIYVRIHKALRLFMFDTLKQLGSADGNDPAQRTAALAQTRSLLEFCAGHLAHENDFLHPAMEARCPGSSGEIAADHVHHEEDIARLLQTVAEAVAQEPAPLTNLYREMALFVSHNLAHMQVEETQHNAVLWAAYTDAELMGIEQALVASLAPEEVMLCMRWMIPAMNHGERVEALTGARDHAPPPVFAALLQIAQQTLPKDQLQALERTLLAPVQIAA